MTPELPATLEGGEVRSAAELGHRIGQELAVSQDEIKSGYFVRVLDSANGQQRLADMDTEHLRTMPRRARGTAALYDPSDFAEYVNRLANDSTTVWADLGARRFTAVFNDHGDTAEDGNAGAAGWRDHTAALHLKVDPDWAAWTSRDGKLHGQTEFAEFLEDHAAVVVEPSAAAMLELAMTFSARRESAFNSAVRIGNGDVQLKWSEQTDAKAGAKGTMEIPSQFTVRLSPYVGVEPVEMVARLRWRLREGQLGIGYKLHRPDLVAREAFDHIRLEIDNLIDAPMLLGTAPSAVTATS